VSVQKVPAGNLRELDEMIAAARRAGVKFRVFENFVFYPPYRKAKEIMDSGEIGKIQSIRIKTASGGGGCGWDVPWDSVAWRLNRDMCGGGPIVWDDGYHKFSLGIFLGGDIDRVYAWIQCTELTPDIKVDTPVLIIWKYKEPLKIGQWESTFAPNMYVPSKYYADDDRVEIQGELGYIWVNQCTGRLLDVAPLQVYKNGVLTNYGNLAKEWEDSFIASTLNFVDAILEDKEPVLSGENARKVLQLALAALKSSETHQEVSPDSITE
jgi:predicted dehydrogenase